MAFYYITFSTAAGGYALVTWLADILKCEPEARSLLVGVVTLTYVGHASFPLRVWRVADSPRYPIGFPLAAAFSAGWKVTLFLIWWWVRRNREIVERGFDIADPVESTADATVAELPKIGSEESWEANKEKA